MGKLPAAFKKKKKKKKKNGKKGKKDAPAEKGNPFAKKKKKTR
jgi:hypothetical protein